MSEGVSTEELERMLDEADRWVRHDPDPQERFTVSRQWAESVITAAREALANRKASAWQGKESEPLAWRIAMCKAIDLLTERVYGNPARSPAHNARLVLEDALIAPPRSLPSNGDGCQKEITMNFTADQIKYMVDRFLSWRLPENFNPDNGISYARPNYHPSLDATPTGTNLLDATQAELMVRHITDGLPSP